MKEIQAPQVYAKDRFTVFLAGSIDMDTAQRWQEEVVSMCVDWDVQFLNPRRDDWDLTIKQSMQDADFYEQVSWEIAGQDDADVIFMYFDPASKAPISLLELGLFARSGKMIVVCPEGYWRRGNVEIVCVRYNVPFVESLEDGVKLLRTLNSISNIN